MKFRKVYQGRRVPGNAEVSVVVYDDKDVEIDRYTLPHRMRHVNRHGDLNWGYGGSGPADLARSILWDYLVSDLERKNRAETLVETGYQTFKSEVVALMKDDVWALTGEEIENWLSDKLSNWSDIRKALTEDK